MEPSAEIPFKISFIANSLVGICLDKHISEPIHPQPGYYIPEYIHFFILLRY